METPAIGSRWRDRDKRMLSGNRIVEVVEVTDFGFVWYVSPGGKQRYRSRISRFVKAFERVEVHKEHEAKA